MIMLREKFEKWWWGEGEPDSPEFEILLDELSELERICSELREELARLCYCDRCNGEEEH